MCEYMWRRRVTLRNQDVFDAILADIVFFGHLLDVISKHLFPLCGLFVLH